MQRWTFLITAAFVVAMDQISKLWITSLHLALGESILEIGPLRLIHIFNTGSAFGLFTDQSFLLSVIAIIGLVAVLVLYRHLPRSSALGNIALGLVFGGAAGNLIDRLRLGHVTDFIDIRLWHNFHWPTFNIADSAITVGVIAIAFFIISSFKKENGHLS